MEELTTQQVLESVLIYSLATVPWLLLVVATVKKKCGGWVLRTVIICSLVCKKLDKLSIEYDSFEICGGGWEVWFNYGIWAGDPVDQRRPKPLNTIMPKQINWILNSPDDGSICMVCG